MTTALEESKIIMQWQDFAKQPINNFKLSGWDLSFRGDISHSIEMCPDNYAAYSSDIDNDETFYRHLKRRHSKDQPFLYLCFGRFNWDLMQVGGGFAGGSYISVSVARIQNIPNVVTILNKGELEQAVSHQFELDDDGEMLGEDLCWIKVGGEQFLQQNCSHKRSAPIFVFYMPIDHRHVLVVDCTFSGFVPIGELLPPPLFDGIMAGVKDFLSHIHLEKSDG